MIDSAFVHLPWLAPAVRTVFTIGAAYLLGRFANLIVKGRLTRWARTTQGLWDDIFIRALTTRIPTWAVLGGAWISLEYWPITDRWVRLVSGTIATVGLLSVTFALAAVATGLVAIYGPRAMPGVPVSGLTQNIIRLVIVMLGLLVVLNELGVEIRPMLAALGVGGLAVALALQEPLSNLFAGLFVTMAGQVRIGDFVRLDNGIEGRVVDFNWRSTSLEVGTGSVAVVPNSKLSQAIVTNFNLPTPEVVVTVDLTVDYASDTRRVEAIATRVAREVATTVDGAVPTAEPVFRFGAFADTGLRGTVALRARTLGDQPAVRHALIVRLHRAFLEEHVVVATSVPPRTP